MRRLLIFTVLAAAATIFGCASEDRRPGLPGVRDVPSSGDYVGRSGTVPDWVPDFPR
jgi:hypothetical protein